jgi:hypothetical protein
MNKSLAGLSGLHCGLVIALGASLAGCGSGDDAASGGGGGDAAADVSSEAGDGGAGDGSLDGARDATGDATVDATADASDASDAGDGAPSCGWTAYQDGLSGANVSDLRFDPRTNSPVAYASAGSTLFRSSDRGVTWTQAGSFTPASIGRLATPGTDPSILLAASGAGVLRSADSGKTWSVQSFNGIGVSVLGVAATQPLRVYAAVDGAGVFRSDDGASTFGSASQGFPSMSANSLEVAPDAADEVVAGGNLIDAQGVSTGAGAVLRSTDGGHTWDTREQDDGLVSAVHRCPSDPTVLYAATRQGVIRSVDRGVTWGSPTSIGGRNIDDVAIAGPGCDQLYAMAEGEGVHVSSDGAATFGPALAQGFDTTPPEGMLAVAPGAPGTVLIGSHGGVWYSTAGGAGWHAGSGLLGMPVTSMSVSPLSPSQVWMSTWGSGIWQRPSSAQPWARVPATALPVDYTFTVAADPFTAGRVVVGGFNTLYSSTDGTTFVASSLSKNEFSIAFDPGSARAVYASTQVGGVFKSTSAADAGALTFDPANTGLDPVVDVRVLALDPAAPQTLYAGTNAHGVYKTVDGAGTWTNVMGPSQITVCLAVVPGASGGVYACVRGSGVQRSVDGGTTWADASQGLSTQDVSALLVDPKNNDLYATAGSLVYVKHGTQPWVPVDACSPGVSPSAPAIVTNGSARSLLVGAGGTVFAHSI